MEKKDNNTLEKIFTLNDLPDEFKQLEINNDSNLNNKLLNKNSNSDFHDYEDHHDNNSMLAEFDERENHFNDDHFDFEHDKYNDSFEFEKKTYDLDENDFDNKIVI